jgi:hypothetical protein
MGPCGSQKSVSSKGHCGEFRANVGSSDGRNKSAAFAPASWVLQHPDQLLLRIPALLHTPIFPFNLPENASVHWLNLPRGEPQTRAESARLYPAAKMSDWIYYQEKSNFADV